MSLKFCSFSSDSSGNCLAVMDDENILLIDGGISGKKTIDSIEALGKSPDSVKAVLITHEHYDHVKCISVLEKKLKVDNFFCSKGTALAVSEKLPKDKLAIVSSGENFSVGDMNIETFALSHDANEPVGYAISNQEGKIVIVTDTGCITPEIEAQIEDADILVIEANHEVNILKMGDYPYELKLRILGKEGHLSNETTANCICDFLAKKKKQNKNSNECRSKEPRGSQRKKPPQIVLAHLSKHNNTPAQAFITVKNLLDEKGYKEGKDYVLSIAVKDTMTPVFSV